MYVQKSNCNNYPKANLSTGQAKLSFPTTCPSCDHSPLEADSCTANKSLRNTMRVWLQKQKKKEEAKAAAQAATPAPETTPAATEVQSEVEGADKPIDSVEGAPATGDASAESTAAAVDAGEEPLRTVSASAQPNEVGLSITPSAASDRVCTLHKTRERTAGKSGWLNIMNTIDLANAGGCSMRVSSCALANIE